MSLPTHHLGEVEQGQELLLQPAPRVPTGSVCGGRLGGGHHAEGGMHRAEAFGAFGDRRARGVGARFGGGFEGIWSLGQPDVESRVDRVGRWTVGVLEQSSLLGISWYN